jgi:hypothetical protein
MTIKQQPTLRLRMAKILDHGFSALDIAEPLYSLDGNQPAQIAKEFMNAKKLEILGIRKNANIVGFVLPDDLENGECSKYVRPFAENILPESASIAEVILQLAKSEFCFISILNTVNAVITKHDIDKPPVRMWLFGIVTIMDMYISRQVEEVFPGDEWQTKLSPQRLEKAKTLQAERQRRNQRARLIDCLQLTDKAYILLKDEKSKKELNYTSRRHAERQIKDFESLRNNLAHTQSLTTYDWETIIHLAERQDTILTRI